MNYSFLKKFCLATTLCLSASVAHAAEFETLSIKQQTSHYMDMKQRITRIAVGNKDIASVIQLPGSVSEFLIVTKATKGSTALFVWTMDGARHEYLIVVSPEDPGQAMMIERAIGLPDVHVKYVDGRLLLTGTVENQYEKNYALQTARLFVNGGTDSSLLVGSGFDMTLDVQSSKSSSSSDVELAKSETAGQIIDLLQILKPTQIRLEAQIIEISSDAARELGLQYGTNGSGGVFSFGESYGSEHRHTSISESYTDNWTNSSSGSNSGSYSNSNSNSYSSGRNWTPEGNTYTNDYNYDYTTNTSNNSRSGSSNNSRDNASSNSRDSNSSRSVTSTWNNIGRSFSNNPVKWITQHFAPINATLTALVNNGKAKVLSRPSVMTLSGEQATIQIGGQIPYTVRNSDGWSTEFKDYGIILQFKPVVDAQNRINSAIHAEVSNINGETGDGQPILATRRADSVINLYSGSPIVIGGLMDSRESKRILKIPLLGDIPIIGEFFKHTSKSRDLSELIIVVTPYLVGEEEISRSPMSQPMREWYDQQEKQREAMESHDFKKSEEVEVIIEKEEPESILPPPKYPKNGKTTDAPFK